jgi:hypothetical protein
MNPQSLYVDANNSYIDVARSSDIYTVSANHRSYYVQKPMRNNIHTLSNLQHVNSSSHASASPEVHMPMNNMMTSVNQYETSNVKNFSNLQDSVSSFYSSVDSSEYIVSPAYMSMDREIGHATTSYLANYPEPSYVAPYVTNFSAPYATGDIHNSASHLHNGYSRISENSIESQVPSSSAAAYGNNDCREKLAAEFKKLNALRRKQEENPCDVAAIHAYESYKKKREEERQACNVRFCPSQLQRFGNTSLPKEKTSIRGQQ